VDANDAMRRILWRHRWLLMAFTLLPVVVVVPLLRLQPTLYSATANVQAQATVPDSDTQVLGLTGRVSAVATSPEVVQSAITAAGVNRNAVDVARNHVAATSVGSSGVVAVTVTDPDRTVAVTLTRALASAVVSSLNSLGSDASSQLAALTDQQAALTASRTSLLTQLAQAQASHQQVTDAGVQALITELNAVETQLSDNVTATQQLLATTGAKAEAGVVNSPSFATAVRLPTTSYAGLAGLLGLVLGLLLVSVRELTRPTVAEPRAGARELGLVLLGDVELSKAGEATPDPGLTARIQIAAHRIGAGTLVLTGPLPPDQLSSVADTLQAALRGADSCPPSAGSRAAASLAMSGALPAPTQISRLARAESAGPTVTVLSDAAAMMRADDQALILVLPTFAPRSALDQAADLAVTTGWPVLGVVAARRLTRRRRKAAAKAAAAAIAADRQETSDGQPVDTGQRVQSAPAATAVPPASPGDSPGQPVNADGPANAGPALKAAGPDREAAPGKGQGGRTLVITAARIADTGASSTAAGAGANTNFRGDARNDKTGTAP
jgi:hypothetical protein